MNDKLKKNTFAKEGIEMEISFDRNIGKYYETPTVGIFNCYDPFLADFEKDDIETDPCENDSGKTLILLKQYEEALRFLSTPFVIVSWEEDIFILLDYNENSMNSPQVYISKKGASAKELLKIAESKNIPITRDNILAKAIMKNFRQFEEVSSKYWEPLAKVLADVTSENHA